MRVFEITADGNESCLSALIKQWCQLNQFSYIRLKKYEEVEGLTFSEFENGLLFIGERECAIWAAHLASKFESSAAVIDPIDCPDDDSIDVQFAHSIVFYRKKIDCLWAEKFNRPIKRFVSVDNLLTEMVGVVNNSTIISVGDGE